MEGERYAVVGLGNPGREFRRNRHNIGFLVADRLAADAALAFTRHRFQALTAEGRWDGRALVLAKPQTYMNLTGRSVGALVRFYRLPLDHLIVVLDDLDLPLGTLRLRGTGGTAGHKGLTSIVETLGTNDVPRLRVGISRPPGQMDPADYVLKDFTDFEWPTVEEALKRAVACIRAYITEGLDVAMNRFNPGPE
jgi:PTH1 family peptidyl-tRNA hydrolase